MLGLFGILPTFQISKSKIKNIEEFIVYWENLLSKLRWTFNMQPHFL
jgi:hypothetical protein